MVATEARPSGAGLVAGTVASVVGIFKAGCSHGYNKAFPSGQTAMRGLQLLATDMISLLAVTHKGSVLFYSKI